MTLTTRKGAAANVGAYPYFSQERGPGERANVELPLQRCRLESVTQSTDALGFPAVSVTVDKRDSPQFEEYTAKHIDRVMVLILNGEVVSEGTINERLPGMIQISGRFTDAQVQEIIAKLSN